MTSTSKPAGEPAVIDLLRAETRDVHERLESGLHVARPGAGREQFLSYLRALHAWQASFEEQLWSAPWPAALQAGLRGGKCAWMQSDLQACQVAPLEARPQWQPPLASQAQRIGLAYVVEGAQLGTRVLAQRLAPALHGWQPRWLQGYGSQTGERWKSFLAQLDTLLAGREEKLEAARAARMAFESLASWFEQCGAASPMPEMESLT